MWGQFYALRGYLQHSLNHFLNHSINKTEFKMYNQDIVKKCKFKFRLNYKTKDKLRMITTYLKRDSMSDTLIYLIEGAFKQVLVNEEKKQREQARLLKQEIKAKELNKSI